MCIRDRFHPVQVGLGGTGESRRFVLILLQLPVERGDADAEGGGSGLLSGRVVPAAADGVQNGVAFQIAERDDPAGREGGRCV